MTAKEAALQFNDFINSRDIDGLSSMMTDDHTFIDSLNTEIKGKENCIIAWKGFFETFPDYENHFTKLTQKNDLVIIEGYSTCSAKILDGPALWRVETANDKISKWRVYEHNSEILDAIYPDN